MEVSYVCGTGDIPLRGITIGELLDETAAAYPERDALLVLHQNLRWSYRQLKRKVDQCARALMAIGIQKGECIGIWAPNRAEWTILQLATAKVGAILVNINPSYQIHELEYALNQSQCKILVTADRSKYSDYLDMIYSLAPELNLGHDLSSMRIEKLPSLRMVIHLENKFRKGMLSWREFMRKSSEINRRELNKRQASLSFDDPINIQYTSGTTGFPKGATLSHHNILNNAYMVTHRLGLSEKDRLLIPVPLYHCFGMVLGNLGCLTQGAAMIYPGEGFEPEKVLEAIDREKATVLYGVPTMFVALLEHPSFGNYDMSSLRTGIMAGALCPMDLMKKVRQHMNMKEVQIAYGLTEASPVCSQTVAGTPLKKRVSTVGLVHPFQEIKIIDPVSGQVVPRGKEGELCIRGYGVMLGYWRDRDKTKEAIDPRGWLHSGDLAIMEKDGYLRIVGRIKDMIIRGGENIYPGEIEAFLRTHPAIIEAQLIGIPDPKYGEEIMAWIQCREDYTMTEEELKDFCKGRIAYYKIPKYIRFTDNFPMTVTGKIRKVEMKEISLKELGAVST